MHNHQFNLHNQLVQEQKSLWRIETYYVVDAKGNKEQEKFWKKMAAAKKKAIAEIQTLIKAAK
jgi:hypothetical protein